VTFTDEDKRYLKFVCKSEHFVWAVEHDATNEEIGTLEEIYADDDDKPDYYFIVLYCFENNFEGRDCKRVIAVELDGTVSTNLKLY